jgi:hypothetical protein
MPETKEFNQGHVKVFPKFIAMRPRYHLFCCQPSVIGTFSVLFSEEPLSIIDAISPVRSSTG